MSDILPQSERYAESDSIEEPQPQPIVWFDSLSSKAKELSRILGADTAEVILDDKPIFVDRFKNLSVDKWSTKLDSIDIKISLWTYSDSLQAKNALFNWLDCFGPKCQNLRLWEDKKLGNCSFVLVLEEKSLYLIENIHHHWVVQDDRPLGEHLKQTPFQYIITQAKGSRCGWLLYDQKRKVFYPQMKMEFDSQVPSDI